jgi:hypothetical protein
MKMWFGDADERKAGIFKVLIHMANAAVIVREKAV